MYAMKMQINQLKMYKSKRV